MLYPAVVNLIGKDAVADREQLEETNQRINELAMETLIIPTYIDGGEYESFLEVSDKNIREFFIRPYELKANRLRESLVKEKNQLKKKQILQEIANCYDIAYIYYNKYGKGPSKDLITLLYYDAKKRLGQIR